MSAPHQTDGPPSAPDTAAPLVCILLGDAPADRLDVLRGRLPAGLTLCVAVPARRATSLEPALGGSRSVLADRPHEALLACIEGWEGSHVLLVDANAELPEFLLPRLLLAACSASATDADVISPLSAEWPQADPRGERNGHSDDVTIDRQLWSCADRSLPQFDDWSRQVSLWRTDALARLAARGWPEAPRLPPDLQARLCDWVWVGGAQPLPARRRPVLPTVEALRTQLAEMGDAAPPYFGLDGKPVLLHVLHGWGGGAERFVRDLMMAGDGSHHQLVLRAVSDYDHRLQGVAIALHHDLDAPALRCWPLSMPVDTTVQSSLEYRDLLESVQRDFAIGGVLVSSLIGHSLDALRTGLPTAVVGHDYYPLWPRLHADFGQQGRDFSAAAIDDALAHTGDGYEFGERSPESWRALRAAYVDALIAGGIRMIAPAAGVRSNQQRIEPRLAQLQWQVIPHGLDGWAQQPAPAPPARNRLRLLVPGRLNQGKGEQLIAELLPQLPADVELILLGCGSAGMRFFGKPRVHVMLNYVRDELPGLVEMLAPDLVLLPSTVAETWSYMLSEVWSLGLPVVATRLGSFAERIRHGEDGLLVSPDAKSIAAELRVLRDDPARLLKLRLAPKPRQSTVAESLAAYTALLAPSRQLPQASAAHGEPPARAAQRQRLQAEAARLAAVAGQLKRELDERQLEVERRSDWAFDLQRQIEQAQAALDALNVELQQRTDWAHQLARNLEASESRIRELDVQLAGVRSALASTEEEREELRRYLAAALSQRDQFESERNAILASSSWRLTRPLRFAARKLRAALARLRFQAKRASAVRHRTLRSLKVRGLRGTLARARREFVAQPKGTALEVPAAVAEFVPFAIPDSVAPTVSVIVPVYNHLDHTLTCLRAIAACGAERPFEVIVVDDCSADDSERILPQVQGLHYLRNAQNLGFIGACNAGATAARGEWLVFLNNDTAVQPGWLDALIDTFEAHADVGLVGAKLVYPDGRLQEAGGIVFADGSGWNYGRFEDPADPRFNFVREVDYCSGAAIALRAALFDELGGFDMHYAPAYYEDTDLAMQVRTRGLRVLYQPRSVVVHFEGVTSGTDTGSGVKAYQVVNQQKFLQRWGETLAREHPKPGTPIEIARQHRCRHQVLVIDATTPCPDQDSGSVRLVNILRILRDEGAAVSFFADNRAYLDGYSSALQQLGVEVLWHPWLSDPVAWIAGNGSRFDLVIVSRHYIASSYVELLRLHARRARLVFDTVDLHYLREQRAAELENRDDLRQTAAQTRERELALINTVDVTLVVSPVEQELLAREAPGARVEVLSNVHEVFGCRRGFAARRDLMFIGGFQHPPNIDAAQWFVREIFPLVRAALPDVRFHLIGSKATDAVRELGDTEGVEFHGFVEDIEPFLDGCRLAMAPLRYGAGVKGKVNMSMSYGQPVVATSIAVEGMHAQPGREVLVADEVAAFAAATVHAYTDEVLWRQLSEGGLANVERHFSFEAARQPLRRLLERG